eukprot:1160604-Pelagomonas_calceolata.AAC.7
MQTFLLALEGRVWGKPPLCDAAQQLLRYMLVRLHEVGVILRNEHRWWWPWDALGDQAGGCHPPHEAGTAGGGGRLWEWCSLYREVCWLEDRGVDSGRRGRALVLKG